jgi:hypothetical protein
MCALWEGLAQEELEYDFRPFQVDSPLPGEDSSDETSVTDDSWSLEPFEGGG